MCSGGLLIGSAEGPRESSPPAARISVMECRAAQQVAAAPRVAAAQRVAAALRAAAAPSETVPQAAAQAVAAVVTPNGRRPGTSKATRQTNIRDKVSKVNNKASNKASKGRRGRRREIQPGDGEGADEVAAAPPAARQIRALPGPPQHSAPGEPLGFRVDPEGYRRSATRSTAAYSPVDCRGRLESGWRIAQSQAIP